MNDAEHSTDDGQCVKSSYLILFLTLGDGFDNLKDYRYRCQDYKSYPSHVNSAETLIERVVVLTGDLYLDDLHLVGVEEQNAVQSAVCDDHRYTSSFLLANGIDDI